MKAGATRAVLLPFTSVAALVTAHIEIDALGSLLFGILTLLLAITLLLPFADLGIGGAVTNAVARRASGQYDEALVAASLRLLVVVCGVVIGVAALLTTASLWGDITGVSHSEFPALGRDMLFVSILFGLGLPLGLGGRILLGLDRYPLFLVTQGCIPFVTLGIVFAFRGTREPSPFLLAPFIAQILASVAALTIALSLLRLRPGRLWTMSRTSQSRAHREIRKTAMPMMLITIGLPIALQTDRLVLSHVATRAALSSYAIVSMLYLPAWSIVSSAGLSLWPRFAGMGSKSPEYRVLAYRRSFRVFALTGGLAAIVLVFVGPEITNVWAGRHGGGLGLWGAFGLLLLVQAAHLPGGMYLTQPAGLRFQSRCVISMCAVNLPLSIGLATSFGAAGPVLASALTIFVFQLLTARRRILRSPNLNVEATGPSFGTDEAHLPGEQ